MLPLRENEPLSRHTSMRVGGPARWWLETADPQQLREALQWAAREEIPVFVLGGGTNLLVRDSGFPGLVVRYTAQEWRIDEESGLVTADAGVLTSALSRRLMQQGWAGMEWAEGLPGTIGGATYGNSGCYGAMTGEIVQRITVLQDGEIRELTPAEMDYRYRHSSFIAERTSNGSYRYDPHMHIVLSTQLQIQRGDPQAVRENYERISTMRRMNTPKGHCSGSVFKNPAPEMGVGWWSDPERRKQIEAAGADPDVLRRMNQSTGKDRLKYVGSIVEDAGVKGMQVGGAQVSTVHGNYIMNTGGATCDDVLHLVDLMRKTIRERVGIDLVPEVHLLPHPESGL